MIQTPAAIAMGNCYGKGSSRRERRELTRRRGNGPTQEADVHLESGKTTSLSSPEPLAEAARSKGSDETDCPPLHGVIEGAATPFNTPATPNGILDAASFDPNALDQKVTDQLLARFVVPRPQTSLLRRARIHYVPPGDWSTCAYCNHPSGDRYGYFLCSSMSLRLLDQLMENGWWRTGEVLFKPCFPLVCCPGYTLRMPIAEFVLKKKHRRVIRRWAGFLRHGDARWDDRDPQPAEEIVSPSETIGGEEEEEECASTVESGLVRTAVASAVIEKVDTVVSSEVDEDELSIHGIGEKEDSASVNETATTAEETEAVQSHERRREKKAVTPGRGADRNRPPCRKAKQVREERRRRRLQAAGKDPQSSRRKLPPAQQPPSLHELLSDHRLAARDSATSFKHRINVKLLGCNPRHPELNHTLDSAYKLYSKFQENVHPGKTRFKSASDFEWGFMRSPVVNPIGRLEGSYHMHYYLDDELVMISILDVLPKYFVSIYFIYDPDIRFLKPGIYTILVELDLVQQLGQQQSTHPHYYALGYYNSNPKVSYKAQFKPQEVLCNETHVFVPMESALPKLAEKPYTRLAGEEVAEKDGRTASLDHLLIDTRVRGEQPVPYQFLGDDFKTAYSGPLRDLLSETGTEAAQQMVIAVHV